jgi:hypothetical protein
MRQQAGQIRAGEDISEREDADHRHPRPLRAAGCFHDDQRRFRVGHEVFDLGVGIA